MPTFDSITLEPALAEHAGAIADVYAHHVAHGVATFDTSAPGEAAWRDKITTLRAAGHAFRVALLERQVVGFGYVAQFRHRPGYRHCCEDSIYIASGMVGRGIGTQLLGALIADATSAFAR